MRVVLLAISLVGCRAIVDRTSYHECDRASYAEQFALGSTMETLYERCWRLANTSNDVSNVFIYDDDLVIRVADASAGQQLEQWAGADQAPMVYQELEGNFVAVVRVEPVDKIDGSHCLAEGNTAGLVARQQDEWATLMVAPMEGFECEDGAEMPPPAFAELTTKSGLWGQGVVDHGPEDAGIGSDAEGDIAVCRISNTVTYWYRDPRRETSGVEDWIPLEADGARLVHSVASGPMEIGLTAAGKDESFEVEGHFQFAYLTDAIRPDGCPTTLGELGVPPLD